jgi:hypothetical protein
MFLKCYETNEYVVDFQIIYDTDNILNVDFYADGLLIEPTVLFGKKTHYEKSGYGLVKTNINKHNRYEKMFNEKIRDKEFLEKNSKDMILSIRNLHRNCRIVEKNLSNLSITILENFYNSICKVMSYRRMVEKIQDEIKLISINNSNVKSYILKLNEQLYKLSKGEIDNNTFIWKYGFLYDFNITLSAEKIYIYSVNG